MNFNKIIISAAAGMAAGALLGVLFAPAKGSDTRKKIAKTSKDLSDSVAEKYHDIRDTIAGPFRHAKSKVSGNANPESARAEAA